MTTNAKIGFGNLFKIGDGNSPIGYTAIGEGASIKPPNISRDAVDATHSQSPNGFREFIGGLRDAGEVTVEFNLIPKDASLSTLISQFDTTAAVPYRIEFVDGTTWDFNGILTGLEPEAPMEDKMMMTATFKVSGQPVLTQP